jgi:hypothetical protein
MTTWDDKLLDRKPRGVSLAEKVTNFEKVTNMLHLPFK